MENSVIQEIARAAPEVDIRTLSALMEAGISDPPTETENELLDYDLLLTLDGHAVWLEDGTCFIVCANYRRPNGEREPCGFNKWSERTDLHLLAECGVYRRNPKREIGGATEFLTERNRALLSCDRLAIERFARRYGLNLPADNTAFWTLIHFAILSLDSFPADVREKSEQWLASHDHYNRANPPRKGA